MSLSLRARHLLGLLLLTATLHLGGLGFPRAQVFDEVYFGAFASHYVGDGGYFFDIHPPHGKLLIAGVARGLGYRGEQEFGEIGAPIDQVHPFLLRLVPALAGMALPLMVYGLLTQLGVGATACLVAGLGVALDNALLVQTRIIAIDGTLLVGTLGSAMAALAATRAKGWGRTLGWAALGGVACTLAVGSKFTGLAGPGLAGLVVLDAGIRERRIGRLVALSAVAIGVFALLYLGGWWLHFELLPNPGPGDVWGRPVGEFWTDTVTLHGQMLRANAGLRAEHPFSSYWWGWPFMWKPMSYWNGDGGQTIWLLGNPVVWWGSTLGMLALIFDKPLLWLYAQRYDFRLPSERPGRHPLTRGLLLLLGGYAIAFGPLAAVQRPLFLYHYLTSLLLAWCAVMLFLDREGFFVQGGWRAQKARVRWFVAAIVTGFVVQAPYTISYLAMPRYRAMLDQIGNWFRSWGG